MSSCRSTLTCPRALDIEGALEQFEQFEKEDDAIPQFSHSDLEDEVAENSDSSFSSSSSVSNEEDEVVLETKKNMLQLYLMENDAALALCEKTSADYDVFCTSDQTTTCQMKWSLSPDEQEVERQLLYRSQLVEEVVVQHVVVVEEKQKTKNKNLRSM